MVHIMNHETRLFPHDVPLHVLLLQAGRKCVHCVACERQAAVRYVSDHVADMKVASMLLVKASQITIYRIARFHRDLVILGLPLLAHRT